MGDDPKNEKSNKEIVRGDWKGKYGQELWNADLSCRHKIRNAGGGGVICVKCKGWCCY